MGIGYQAVDRNVIDYDLWFDPETNMAFRGPRGDLSSGGGIVCIGAAQTFGRFVHRPYPAQLSELLQRPVLNLGVSGAGPEFYLERPPLMDRLARAEIAVVQAMSARSVTAGRFRTKRMNKGVLSFVDGPMAGQDLLAQNAYQLLRDTEGEEAFQAQVKAVQERWVALHQDLAERLPERKLLLWLSSKHPGDNLDLSRSPVGTFPHFVTAAMVESVEAMGFEIVLSVLRDMPPEVLINDRTGVVEEVFKPKQFPHRPDKLRVLNTYYATSDLHNMANQKLAHALLSR